MVMIIEWLENVSVLTIYRGTHIHSVQSQVYTTVKAFLFKCWRDGSVKTMETRQIPWKLIALKCRTHGALIELYIHWIVNPAYHLMENSEELAQPQRKLENHAVLHFREPLRLLNKMKIGVWLFLVCLYVLWGVQKHSYKCYMSSRFICINKQYLLQPTISYLGTLTSEIRPLHWSGCLTNQDIL